MSSHKTKKYVLLAGGFTGGPVKPLLAVIKHWQVDSPEITPVIVDVRNAVSNSIAEEEKIAWERIITAKLRRYWSIRTLFMPILLLVGFVRAVQLLRKYRPIAVLGAGGFVQVPLIIAAWLMRIPRFIHQQDVLTTLSNRICSHFATMVTTTFEFSIRDFPQGTGLGKKYINGTKVYWTGNPIDNDEKLPTSAQAKKELGLHNDLPVLLVFGGGTGAVALNEIIYRSLPALTKVAQVVHITGLQKGLEVNVKNYYSEEYSDDMPSRYAAADIVLSRAGIGTLTELAEFAKPSIIVPMPHTHQELNAELLFRAKAALVLDQNDIDEEVLINSIRKILFDREYQKQLTHNMRLLFPKNAAEETVSLIKKYLKKHG